MEAARNEDERGTLDFIRQSRFTNFNILGLLTGLEVRTDVWSCHSAPANASMAPIREAYLPLLDRCSSREHQPL